jgi:predicted Zn-dependent protease
MEEEADAQALKFMQRTCLPAQRFADIMERLDPASKTPKAQRMEGAFALFSTHPQTLERIKAFQRRELVTSGC